MVQFSPPFGSFRRSTRWVAGPFRQQYYILTQSETRVGYCKWAGVRAVHCGKPGRRTCMFSYEPFTAILEVPEVSPEVVWLLWVVGEALGTTSAPLKAQKPAKTS